MLKKQNSLKEYYDKVKSLQEEGFDINPEFLKKEFDISPCKASCLMYMLMRGSYLPGLESISRFKEVPNLRGKKESKNQYIIFNEDIPPYKADMWYDEEIAEDDKKQYVLMGFAKYITLEEARQRHIAISWGLGEALRMIYINLHKEFNLGNKEFFKEYFKGKDDNYILDALKRADFNSNEIKTIFSYLT